MKNKFEEFGCELKNESECEEELDEEGLEFGKIEIEYFGDD